MHFQGKVDYDVRSTACSDLQHYQDSRLPITGQVPNYIHEV